MSPNDSLELSTTLIIFAAFYVFLYLLLTPYNFSVYLLLKKAKYKNPWAAWVPIYQQWAINEIAGKPVWWSLLGLASFVTIFFPDSLPFRLLDYAIFATLIVLYVIVEISLAKAFGKSLKYALGLIFIPFPMYLVLALSDSKYIGPKKAKSRKR